MSTARRRHPLSGLSSLLLVTALIGASVPPGAARDEPPTPSDPELDRLAEWMSGEFDTFAQVEEDEARGAEYTHLRVVMRIVPVTVKGLSETARAFYVEQAAAEAQDRPYRQRVYLLQRRDGRPVNRIYRLRDPERFVGAHADPDRLSTLASGDLELSEGCDLVWTRAHDGLYRGVAGAERSCPTSLRGATWALSRVEMTPTTLTSLDQGFDDEGQHRWGPPPGVIGHVFVKRQPSPGP
jgi:hypothetical protein